MANQCSPWSTLVLADFVHVLEGLELLLCCFAVLVGCIGIRPSRGQLSEPNPVGGRTMDDGLPALGKQRACRPIHLVQWVLRWASAKGSSTEHEVNSVWWLIESAKIRLAHTHAREVQGLLGTHVYPSLQEYHQCDAVLTADGVKSCLVGHRDPLPMLQAALAPNLAAQLTNP